MNSFWIPELGGQIYAMPGMISNLHLIADDKGSFRGSSANISGEGFAGMTFVVNATSQAEFDKWVESVNKSSTLGLRAISKLAKPSSYDPVATYTLGKEDLFDWIAMRPMMTSQAGRKKQIKVRSQSMFGKLNIDAFRHDPIEASVGVGIVHCRDVHFQPPVLL